MLACLTGMGLRPVQSSVQMLWSSHICFHFIDMQSNDFSIRWDWFSVTLYCWVINDPYEYRVHFHHFHLVGVFDCGNWNDIWWCSAFIRRYLFIHLWRRFLYMYIRTSFTHVLKNGFSAGRCVLIALMECECGPKYCVNNMYPKIMPISEVMKTLMWSMCFRVVDIIFVYVYNN